MSYYISTTLQSGFDEVLEKTTAALKEEGFGILTEIDVAATLKKKLDVDYKAYTILGACNPPLAHKALQTEDKIGVMLPCNVVVIDQGEHIEVAAIDPYAGMSPVENDKLNDLASDVRQRLQRVIDALGA